MFGEMYRDKRDELVWGAVGLGAAVVGGIATRNLIKAGWRSYYDENPPLNPASHDTSWQQAILFTAVMGAGMGVARMLGRRSAAEAWRKVTGDYPKPVREGERKIRA